MYIPTPTLYSPPRRRSPSPSPDRRGRYSRRSRSPPPRRRSYSRSPIPRRRSRSRSPHRRREPSPRIRRRYTLYSCVHVCSFYHVLAVLFVCIQYMCFYRTKTVKKKKSQPSCWCLHPSSWCPCDYCVPMFCIYMYMYYTTLPCVAMYTVHFVQDTRLVLLHVHVPTLCLQVSHQESTASDPSSSQA